MFTKICFIMVSQLLVAYGVTCCNPADTGLFPHPDKCHQYYDCSSTEETLPGQGVFLKECKYPQYFDGDNCVDYNQVKCGKRKAPTDACEYITTGCMGHSHCVPCEISYPSCKNKVDGSYAHPNKPNSPMYYTCEDGRNSGPEQTCPKDNLGVYMTFDVKSGTCKKMEDIVTQ